MTEFIIKIINQLNFKKKLIITYIIVALISVMMVGGYFMTTMRISIMNQVKEQSQNDLQSIEARFTQIISRINGVSDELYFNRALENIAFTEYANAQQAFNDYEAFEKFNNILNVSPEIQEIKIYFDNSTVIENGEFMQLTPEIRETEWYQVVKRESGAIVWQYYLEPGEKNAAIRLTRLLKSMDKQIVGILDIELNENYLYSLIKNESFFTMVLLNGNEPFILSQNKEGYEKVVRSGSSSFEKCGYEFENMVFGGEKYISASNTFTIDPSENLFTVCMLIPNRTIEERVNTITMKGLTISIVALIISFIFLYVFSVLFSRRINRLRYEMDRVVNGDFEEHINIDGKDEIAILYNDLCNVRKSIKNLINGIYEQKKIEEELRKKQMEIELQLLSNEINPHFLFNTLETIRMKAHCSNEKDIARAVKLLARIMRRRLKMTQLMEQPICLGEELKLIADYLEILKFRYGERINYRIDAKETDLDYKILSFLIQPIVENAFIHGLENKKEGGYINIYVQNNGNSLVIRISDNGVGIQPERLKQIADSFSDPDERIGIGLKNVNDRIRIFYGSEYGISLQSQFGKGTVIVITLPGKEQINA